MIEFTDFHFIRPLWLLALPIALLLLITLIKQSSQKNSWQKWVDSSLLAHLLDGRDIRANRHYLWVLGVAWIVACLAMAGPTWEKRPQPVLKKTDSVVIVLDLSPSMNARDVNPDRLTRARFKLTDLLKAKKEGQAALVVYGGEAYVVTPLSDDMATIIAQLPALEPDLMPVRGSNTEMAVGLAVQLLEETGNYDGTILLVTDGVVPAAARAINEQLKETRYRLSILGVGTADGAPVPIRDSFAKDNNGNMIIDRVDFNTLSTLASDNRGRFSPMRSDDLDIQYLTADYDLMTEQSDNYQTSDNQQFDLWLERGPFLALLLIPIVALSFRRGWLLGFGLCALSTALPPKAEAFEWADLWKSQDQQAYEQLQNGNSAAAAEQFEDSQWAASAHYRNGDYQQAQQLFDADTATGAYNTGNALAKSGYLQDALAAYERALSMNPDMDDAKFNHELVSQLLDQQQNQQQDQQQSDSDQPQDQNSDSGGQSQQDQSQSEQNNQASNQSDSQSQQQDEQQQADSQQANSDKSNSPEQSQSNENNQPSEQQQAQSDQQPGEEQQDQQTQEAQQAVAGEPQESNLTEEQQQALTQWLKEIPDDPSGLLRRKFQHQYRQRLQDYQRGEWRPPENNAANRL